MEPKAIPKVKKDHDAATKGFIYLNHSISEFLSKLSVAMLIEKTADKPT